jgi:hypothetical protein
MHLETEIEKLNRCTWRARLSVFGDAFGSQKSSNSEMYLEAVIERIW